MVSQRPQNDLLIVMALAHLTHEFRDVEPELADRAWHLAAEVAAVYGLTPSEAVLEFDWNEVRKETPRLRARAKIERHREPRSRRR